MNYSNACAAKGARHDGRTFVHRSMQRAAVNVYRTETSYEMLVFAPGRVKEQFGVSVAGSELTVSYTPPEGFPKVDWIIREYSRGGFVRKFTLPESADVQSISATYIDGVLQISIPLKESAAEPARSVTVS